MTMVDEQRRDLHIGPHGDVDFYFADETDERGWRMECPTWDEADPAGTLRPQLTNVEWARYLQWRVVNTVANPDTLWNGWIVLSSASEKGVHLYVDITWRVDDEQFWKDINSLAEEFGADTEVYEEGLDEGLLGWWLQEPGVIDQQMFVTFRADEHNFDTATAFCELLGERLQVIWDSGNERHPCT